MADDVDPIAAEFEQQRKRAAEADEVARINARTPGEVLNRDVRAVGTGVNDAIGSVIGAVPDAIGAGMRAVGLPSSAPGQYTKWAQGGLNAVGDAIYGKLTPDTPTERNLYAAGHGAGDALSMVVPATGAARLGGVVGGVAGQLAENPVTQAIAGAAGGSATQASGSPLVGLGASMLVPFGAGAARGVVSPGASQLNPEQARLAGVATREGIQLTPGQLSGSRPMRTMDSVFKDLPLTSGTAHADEEAQRIAFNRAALLRAGETGENLATPDVVNAALARAGQGMGNIYGANNFRVDAPSMQAVTAVANNAARDLPGNVAHQVRNRVDDFIAKIRPDGQGGLHVEGPAFQALDSELSRTIRSVDSGEVRLHLGRLQEALRDGMEASLSPEDAQALATFRRQYANGMIIREAINAPSAATAAGHIPATRLSTVLAGDNEAYARGRGDLNDVARVGRTFIQDPIPNSGTSMRSAMTQLLQGGAVLGGGLAGGNLAQRALLGGGALALPSVIQALARSNVGRAYLTNQAAAGVAPQVTRGTLAGIGGAQLPGLLGAPPGPGPRVAPIDDPRFQPQ
jgi:hypothetical protein